jgi:hypothetical protein
MLVIILQLTRLNFPEDLNLQQVICEPQTLHHLSQKPVKRQFVRQPYNNKFCFLSTLTQHLILGNIKACNAKAGISIGVISVD